MYKILRKIIPDRSGEETDRHRSIQINVGLVAAWGIPTAIMLVIFFLRSIYPFGSRSFLYMDMYHQYMPFFSELYHKLHAGAAWPIPGMWASGPILWRYTRIIWPARCIFWGRCSLKLI